jgi:hypothetical protein
MAVVAACAPLVQENAEGGRTLSCLFFEEDRYMRRPIARGAAW